MTIKSFVSNIELNNELISHYFKPYNNKRLDKFQKIQAIIWKEKSNRNDTYE
jgi:hypothetical protein